MQNSSERKTKAISATGCPIGQDSARAKYLDSDIDNVLLLRSQGLSYRQIANKMDMPRSTVFAICKGIIRSQVVWGFRTVRQKL